MKRDGNPTHSHLRRGCGSTGSRGPLRLVLGASGGATTRNRKSPPTHVRSEGGSRQRQVEAPPTRILGEGGGWWFTECVRKVADKKKERNTVHLMFGPKEEGGCQRVKGERGAARKQMGSPSRLTSGARKGVGGMRMACRSYCEACCEGGVGVKKNSRTPTRSHLR